MPIRLKFRESGFRRRPWLGVLLAAMASAAAFAADTSPGATAASTTSSTEPTAGATTATATNGTAQRAQPPLDKSAGSELSRLALLLLSPDDGLAVLERPDGELLTVGLHEVVPGTAARVVGVREDRLVLEERSAKGPQRTVWMSREPATGQTRLQVLERKQPPLPPVLLPVDQGNQPGFGPPRAAGGRPG